MAESAAEHIEATEQPEISKEESSSASEVVHLILKTSKAFKMYLPNNPLLARFLDDLKASLSRHLGIYGEIKLDMDQFSLRYRGKNIYESRDPKDSLAFKMYSDGIRSLIFSEGIEDREIYDFLEIVGKDRPGEADDDIVTLLWAKDLPHITYILAEDYLEFDTAGSGQANSGSQQESIKGVYKSVPPSPPVPTPIMIPQNILVLSDEEISWIKTAKDIDENRSPLAEVINIISSILAVEKDPAVFNEFVDIISNLIGNLIHSADVGHSVTLIRFLNNLSKDETIPPSHRERLRKSMDSAVSDDIIKDLEGIIATEDKITPGDLKDFLALFGVSNIKSICELLGNVQKMEMRKVIIDALVEIGKGSPQSFFPFLTDRRWYLVRNAVLILRRIADPVSLEPVSRLIHHSEPKIRREVLTYLESSQDPRAKTYILKYLHDDVGYLRLHALKVLASSKLQGLLKPVLEMTTSKEFDHKDMAEKKATFEAIGELGSDEMIPLFREMILKRYWFNKSKEKESVICAVAGLRKIRTDAAVKVLEEAAAVKSERFRTFINKAIRIISIEKEKVRAS